MTIKSYGLRTCVPNSLSNTTLHIQFNVRREHLLLDLVKAVMSLSREDLQNAWRIQLIGREDTGQGGLA